MSSGETVGPGQSVKDPARTGITGIHDVKNPMVLSVESPSFGL